MHIFNNPENVDCQSLHSEKVDGLYVVELNSDDDDDDDDSYYSCCDMN